MMNQVKYAGVIKHYPYRLVFVLSWTFLFACN
jgi:hypothetical protein